MSKRPLSRHLGAIIPTPPRRELCWRKINEYDRCDLWENHDDICLATCGDCKEGRCHLPLRPPVPGVGDPSCGCARHADSLEAYRRDQEPAEEWPDELLNARIKFWQCPDRHPDRKDDKGYPVRSVEWRGDVAYCLEPGCGKTSAEAADDRG